MRFDPNYTGPALRYYSLGSFHGLGITWSNDIGPGVIVGKWLIFWGPDISVPR